MHRITKFYQNQSNDCWDIAFNNFLNGAEASTILNLKKNVKLQITNMCFLEKFHQNYPNSCADIVIVSIFEMAAVCHLWFWKFSSIWSLISLGKRICIAKPNFIKMHETLAKISHLTFFHIAVVCRNRFLKIWSLNSALGVLITQKFECITLLPWKRLFVLFCCFGVKNGGKWKLSTFLSFCQCNKLQLTLQWLICIVLPNFIKISQMIVEISHLTIF